MEREIGTQKGSLRFLAEPKGELPPRCCARCRYSLYCFNKSEGRIMLKCMHKPAVEVYGIWHEKEDEVFCEYFTKIKD